MGFIIGFALEWVSTLGRGRFCSLLIGEAFTERRTIMAEDTGSGGAMWAVATLLIVLVVVAALYFGGAFTKKKSIDININKPGIALPITAVNR